MTNTRSGHWTCQHRLYRLSCIEYDDLYEHAEGRCEICGIKEAFASQGKLYIDHDHTLGDEVDSVRGLLCQRCNTGVDRKFKPMTGPDVDAYLANPWHARPRMKLYPPPPPAMEDMPPDERLDLVGSQLLRVREHDRLSSRSARKFVREQVRPAIREARRAGITARVIAAKTGYTPEYVRLIWNDPVLRGRPSAVSG